MLGARFFLPKSGANGHAPELGRELPNEGEARVEALKMGVTYYSVQEWRCGLAATRLGRADGCGHWQELTGCGDLAAGRREYDAWRRLLPTTPLRLIARPSGHVIERQPGR